jgi:hypothetical protein
MSRVAAHFSIFLYFDQDCMPAKLESQIRDVSCLALQGHGYTCACYAM